jgi:ABC-type uncharacterized transport system involved in gliding motility auxiliary subunit
MLVGNRFRSLITQLAVPLEEAYTRSVGILADLAELAAVVLAAPSVHARALGAMTEPEVTRLRSWLLEGGNLLVAIGPESDAASPALKPVLEPFGIGLGERLVLDPEPKLMVPDTRANTYIAAAKAHPVTLALVPNDDVRDVPHIVLDTTRALSHLAAPGAAAAGDLVVSSERSFAVTPERAIAIGRMSPGEVPDKEPGDEAGPFVLAMASERPKTRPSASHGPRVVVLGSSSALSAQHWHAPTPFRGSAILVENAIAWLASQPQVLDIPARPSVSAGMRVSDESRSEVRRYVLVFMPLAAALLGVAVALRRKSTEGVVRRAGSANKPKRDESDDDAGSASESDDGEHDGP